MKFREAIKMILDGGELWREKTPQHKYIFKKQKNGNKYLYSLSGWYASDDEFAIDWIVEKDGIIYEDYCKFCDECKMPNKVTINELSDNLYSLLNWVIPKEFFMPPINEVKLCFDKERINFMRKLEYLVSLQEK